MMILEYHSPRTFSSYTSSYLIHNMRNCTKLVALLALGGSVDAAFGVTSTTKGFKVDTDGGLVFEVNKFFTPLHVFLSN
jgi:hypothetical protein